MSKDITQQSKKFTNKNGVSIVTNYRDAVAWCHNDFILCNDIVLIDDTIYDNMRFNMFDEEDNAIEIYQWFLTSASESDIEYLEKRFGLLFTYSEKLGLYILCVPHFGTSWDYVYCGDSENDIKSRNEIAKAGL